MSLSTKEELQLMDGEMMWLLGGIENHLVFTDGVLQGYVRLNALNDIITKLHETYGGYRGLLDFIWVYYHHGVEKAEKFVKHYRSGKRLTPFPNEEWRDAWLKGVSA